MRSQAERDQQTVTIATALAIFVVIVGLAVGLGAYLDPPEGAATVLGIGGVVLAAALALTYLVRHRRA